MSPQPEDFMYYSRSVKVGVLKKVLPPGNQSVVAVSRETGISHQTIRNWLKDCSCGKIDFDDGDKSPRDLNDKEKYLLLMEAAGISDEEKGLFLRERGLQSEHLRQWDRELREIMDKKKQKNEKESRKNAAQEREIKNLKKELKRKDAALAEAAALLLLKKKMDALIGDQEEG
jgi:transposase